MRGNQPITTGGINDPVAQSIRNEQNHDAAPSPSEIAQMNASEQQLIDRLTELAENGVFLKNRDTVSEAADNRDWQDVTAATDNANDQRWQSLIAQALSQRDSND